MVWTALFFSRRADGKAAGADCVVTILLPGSCSHLVFFFFFPSELDADRNCGWDTFCDGATHLALDPVAAGDGVEEVATVTAEYEGSDN